MTTNAANSVLSYEQAAELALKLKRQGRTYAEIEAHLKGINYVSGRTHRPIKEMAIRYMINKAEKDEQVEKRMEKEEEKQYANTAKRDADLRILLASRDLPVDLKLELIEALVNYQPKGRVALAVVPKENRL